MEEEKNFVGMLGLGVFNNTNEQTCGCPKCQCQWTENNSYWCEMGGQYLKNQKECERCLNKKKNLLK